MRHPGTLPLQRGLTIVEMTIVALLIAIAVAVAIPLIGRWLEQYNLGIAAQQVADSLQATKMQAVAKTRRRELLFDVPGNRLGMDGAELVPLGGDVRFGRGNATVVPDPAVATEGAVTFPAAEDDTGLRAAAFTGRGIPDAEPGEVFAVFLTNTAGTRAVLMTSAGNVRVVEWRDGGWR